MSLLFTPWELGGLRCDNRIVVAPMCQYSAREGNAGAWHRAHLPQMAFSGAGLVIVEATAVSAEGRITPGDLGLYSDANEQALAQVLAAIREHAAVPVAMQLGHAGRKASCRVPWEGGTQIREAADGAWQTLAPSAQPHNGGERPPLALDDAGLAKIRADFVAAALRAARLGLAGLEIHMAHGYLLHQFLSPLANRRTDGYGGALAHRMRFPLEVFDAVRQAFPADRPVWVRISATDWVEGGWDVVDSVALARELKALGCAAVHVSSGGISPAQKIKAAPGYQVPFAREVREQAGLPTIAVGLVTQARQAEAILQEGHADAVALARRLLYDPRWPWHAAAELGAQVTAPPQYWRCQPREVPDLFSAAIDSRTPGASG